MFNTVIQHVHLHTYMHTLHYVCLFMVAGCKDYKADIYSVGVVCWNVLTGGIKDAAGAWSTPCYPFSAHNFNNLANNYRLLDKYVIWTYISGYFRFFLFV